MAELSTVAGPAAVAPSSVAEPIEIPGPDAAAPSSVAEPMDVSGPAGAPSLLVEPITVARPVNNEEAPHLILDAAWRSLGLRPPERPPMVTTLSEIGNIQAEGPGNGGLPGRRDRLGTCPRELLPRSRRGKEDNRRSRQGTEAEGGRQGATLMIQGGPELTCFGSPTGLRFLLIL